MENLFAILAQFIKSQTFWTAVSAIFSIAGWVTLIITIIVGIKQLRFDAWLKAQALFTEPGFTANRGWLYTRLDKLDRAWTEDEKNRAKQVCRQMDEFAHLAPFLGGRKKILEVWDDPVGKSWVILKPIIKEEQRLTGWATKWKAFEDLGEEALKKLGREGRDPLRKMKRDS